MSLRPLGSTTPEDMVRVADDNFRNIDNRFRVNVVRQDTGNAIIQGKLPYDKGYGTIYHDSTGTPRLIVGILPDGTLGQQASKPNTSVITTNNTDLITKSDFSSTTYYDLNGIPSIIIGTLPDGTTGLVIAKPNENVLNVFN